SLLVCFSFAIGGRRSSLISIGSLPKSSRSATRGGTAHPRRLSEMFSAFLRFQTTRSTTPAAISPRAMTRWNGIVLMNSANAPRTMAAPPPQPIFWRELSPAASYCATGPRIPIRSSIGRFSETCFCRTMLACSALSGGLGIDSLLDQLTVLRAERGQRPRPGESFFDGAARGGAELARQRGMLDEDAQRAGQLGGAVGVDEPAVLAVADELAHGREVGGDDGDARGHRLQDLQRRAALLDVARAVAERGDGDEGIAPPVRQVSLFEGVLPHDRHLQLLGKLLVRFPRFLLAR